MKKNNAWVMPIHVWAYLLCYCLLTFAHETHAQLRCGTQLDEKANVTPTAQVQRYLNSIALREKQSYTFPIRAYVFQKEDGTGNVSRGVIASMIDEANKYFNTINISFRLINEVIYVDSDKLYDHFIPYEESLIRENYYDPKVINVYIGDMFDFNFEGEVIDLAGKSTFPDRKTDFFPLYMDHRYVLDGKVFTHELGHYLGLLHTHETFLGKELVNRDLENCRNNGDLLCDTEADPNLIYYRNNSIRRKELEDNKCELPVPLRDESGEIYVDSNGDIYRPDPTNIMSYAQEKCWDKFTGDQYQRMTFFADKYVSNRYPTFDPSASYLAFSRLELEVEGDKSEATFRLYSNRSWELSSDVSWLSFSESRGIRTRNIRLSCEANPTLEVRTATVTAKSGSTVRKLKITQGEGTPVSIGKTQVAFVIDDTQSMEEEIGAVRRALQRVLKTYDPSLGTVFQIATFKDNYNIRQPTTNLSEIENVVNNLTAIGGFGGFGALNCEEVSVATLNAIKDQMADNGVIFLATDASPYPGSLYRAVAEYLKSRGIVLHVVLSGDCDPDIEDECPTGSRFARLKDEMILEQQQADSVHTRSNFLPSSLYNLQVSERSADISAFETFTYLTSETGGIFAFLQEVNCNDPAEKTRYENTIFNIIQGGVSYALITAEPTRGPQGSTVTITLRGANTNFNQAITQVAVSGDGDITISSRKVIDATTIGLTLDIAADADIDFYDITATTNLPDGRTEIAVGEGVFQVIERILSPTILGVTPPNGRQGSQLTIAVRGVNTNFVQGSTTLDLENDIDVTSITVLSPTSLQATLNIDPNARVGNRDITVTTGAEVAIRRQAFRVDFAGVSNSYLVIKPRDNFTIDHETTTLVIDIESNIAWTATTNDSWLSITPGSGTGASRLTIRVEGNYEGRFRSGSITVEGDGITRNITIEQGAIVAACSLPGEWDSRDIGTPDLDGEACFNDNQFIVKASGRDIFQTTDEFHYVYQRISGDVQITARVKSLDGTSSYTKGGVMIRENISGASAHAAVHVTRDNGTEFLWRERLLAPTQYSLDEGSAPQWVRLIRRGSRIEAYRSDNGFDWKYMGGRVLNFSNRVYVGLSFTSHDNSYLGQAVFDNVSIERLTSTPPPPPSSDCASTGSITYEFWERINGEDITDLINNPRYPNNPDFQSELNIFESSQDVANNYGARIHGYICPPTTGYYTFWIAVDDAGQLNISTSTDPALKQRIAYVNEWTRYRQWNKYATQKSARVLLQKGTQYYIEALVKEGEGGDHLSIGWSRPGQSTASPSEVVPGRYLIPF